MQQVAVVRRLGGYLVVIDPWLGRNGWFSPRYWIYGEDNLAAEPVASDELPAVCPDASSAIARSEELARAKLADMVRARRP